MDKMLAEPRDMAQLMSMADIDLQSYVFWHTACLCISRGILRFPKSKVP